MSASPTKYKGFTLIELMVVISIIAILSVVGLVTYSGTQKSARDAKRKADIDAIINAYELNKASGYYLPLSPTFFSSNVIPTDPLDSKQEACGDKGSTNSGKCWYCVKSKSFDAASYNIGYCDAQGHTLTEAAGGTWFDSNTTNIQVCANLENANPSFYCRRSSQ